MDSDFSDDDIVVNIGPIKIEKDCSVIFNKCDIPNLDTTNHILLTKKTNFKSIYCDFLNVKVPMNADSKWLSFICSMCSEWNVNNNEYKDLDEINGQLNSNCIKTNLPFDVIVLYITTHCFDKKIKIIEWSAVKLNCRENVLKIKDVFTCKQETYNKLKQFGKIETFFSNVGLVLHFSTNNLINQFRSNVFPWYTVFSKLYFYSLYNTITFSKTSEISCYVDHNIKHCSLCKLFQIIYLLGTLKNKSLLNRLNQNLKLDKTSCTITLKFCKNRGYLWCLDTTNQSYKKNTKNFSVISEIKKIERYCELCM